MHRYMYWCVYYSESIYWYVQILQRGVSEYPTGYKEYGSDGLNRMIQDIKERLSDPHTSAWPSLYIYQYVATYFNLLAPVILKNNKLSDLKQTHYPLVQN